MPNIFPTKTCARRVVCNVCAIFAHGLTTNTIFELVHASQEAASTDMDLCDIIECCQPNHPLGPAVRRSGWWLNLVVSLVSCDAKVAEKKEEMI